MTGIAWQIAALWVAAAFIFLMELSQFTTPASWSKFVLLCGFSVVSTQTYWEPPMYFAANVEGVYHASEDCQWAALSITDANRISFVSEDDAKRSRRVACRYCIGLASEQPSEGVDGDDRHDTEQVTHRHIPPAAIHTGSIGIVDDGT